MCFKGWQLWTLSSPTKWGTWLVKFRNSNNNNIYFFCLTNNININCNVIRMHNRCKRRGMVSDGCLSFMEVDKPYLITITYLQYSKEQCSLIHCCRRANRTLPQLINMLHTSQQVSYQTSGKISRGYSSIKAPMPVHSKNLVSIMLSHYKNCCPTGGKIRQYKQIT